MIEHYLTHDHRPNDKVLIRHGAAKGQRGVVHKASDDTLHVQLPDASIVQVPPDDVTNYSRAARRAWETMPKRAGRPKSGAPRKRMVSLRLDPEIWDRLGRAVEQGLIANREQAVSDWLREQLDILLPDN